MGEMSGKKGRPTPLFPSSTVGLPALVRIPTSIKVHISFPSLIFITTTIITIIIFSSSSTSFHFHQQNLLLAVILLYTLLRALVLSCVEGHSIFIHRMQQFKGHLEHENNCHV
jgi:hypothetical protein